MNAASMMLLVALAASAKAPPAEGPATDEREAAAARAALRLERGLELLEMQEHEDARAELERALKGGPYSFEQAVALYRGLGTVRAFANDIEGSRWAFHRMLRVDPTIILSYTISPKATFVYERVREDMKDLTGVQVTIETEPVVPLDREIPVLVRTKADPSRHVKRLELLYRVKGDAEYQRLPIAFPPPGSQVDVDLPAVSSKRARETREGKEGAFLQLALVGYDENDWEVYRGPAPSAPQELPVGFGAAGPWYTSWWAYGLLASSVAAVAAGMLVWAAVKPPDDPVTTSYEVLQ